MKKLVVANWKMNPASVEEANELFEGIKKKASTLKNVETVIAPPSMFLGEITCAYSGNKVSFASQDVFWEEKGSHTGEVSATQAKSVGATYSLVGHSERRALGETDIEVNEKIHILIKERITPILCIGEVKRDEHGDYLNFLKKEIEGGLDGVSANDVKRVVIAYEPIWAIGKSDKDAMKPDDMHEMKIFIQKVLSEMYERSIATRVRIIYGGSVEPENAGAILSGGEVDGFLVGHASLVVEEFNEILRIANEA
ncbi:MAG: triose-phosphate isomerase [Candidatus Pacebacteria bacterium]|jgi:triosephosphate isomerase|nr:triose-phosphate isomerase [bacterium]MDP6527331.1 triose-phosphate isomerase [Candidatus Paceibacterota bacterium]MDP6659391.1 triose-phosphate isomerase [Candidatus Paceibacterota bacterium]|tara:strand:- start:36647 stop:37408 length:762 start_codon:yes stop_codon:yes gene_type:complete